MAKAIKEDRFKQVLVDTGSMTEARFEVYVDRKTGVNYLFCQQVYASGLCVMVDRDGKPIVSPLPVEE